jgi:hypothetical protein
MGKEARPHPGLLEVKKGNWQLPLDFRPRFTEEYATWTTNRERELATKRRKRHKN